jgi:hypothetical protein
MLRRGPKTPHTFIDGECSSLMDGCMRESPGSTAIKKEVFFFSDGHAFCDPLCVM